MNEGEVRISAKEVLKYLCESAKDEFNAMCCAGGSVMMICFENAQWFQISIKELP